jgi:hypothetical protein
MPKTFKYQARSKEAVKRRAEQSGGDFDSILKDGIKGFSMKEGNYRLRFLPPTWDDAEHYGHDVFIHYGIGADRQSYLCLEKMRDKPCPICQERKRLEASGDSKEAEQLAPRKRVLAWIVDRDKESEGPKIWSMPWTVDKEFNKLCEDRHSGEILQIDHPQKGFDVEVSKEGAKLRTKYGGYKIARSASPLAENHKRLDRWLQYITDHPIPDSLQYYKADYIEKMFVSASGKDEDEEEEEKPVRRRSRDEDEDDQPTRKRPKDEDDEDAEDEQPSKNLRKMAKDADEDEEEERPRKKRPKDDDED